jgi:hypothetical protein
VLQLGPLAKQGWRLIHHQDSLVATIMKEKYYPRTDFLEAKLSARPSFAWRSILNSRLLLQQGLIWRVGNGSSIRIWHDNWLPGPVPQKIKSSIRILHSEAKVCELIDTATNWWNFPLIHEVLIRWKPNRYVAYL